MAKLQPCLLSCGEIEALPAVLWQNCSLAHNLILIPLLLLDRTHHALSWWTQAHLNPCLGHHLLQEGFGRSSSLGLRGRGAGWDVVPPKANGCRGQNCYHRHSGMGPVTDGLDHRSGASIYHAAFGVMNIVQTHWHMLTLSSHLCIY